MPEPPTSTPPRRVFISVAEVSGDENAAAFIRSLHELDPAIIVEGLGGPRMREAGAVIHHETVGGAAMLLHGLSRAGEIWRLLRWTRRHFQTHKPDLQVCVDSSGMNFHFAKVAREAGVPVLYYVAPQLWASRPGRIKQLRRWINRVASIIPFEEEYFRQRGVEATFVGHPLFDRLPAERPSLSRPPAVQELAHRPPVVGLLPGSRRTEVRANFPHMLQVARLILAQIPQAKFLVPATASTHSIAVQIAAQANVPNLRIESDAIDAMLPTCDLCIAKSGTTTLHAAAYGIPMIVVYRLNPLVWHLAGRFIVKTKSIALVNLLAGPRIEDRIVPEIVPWWGSDLPVAQMALEMLREPHHLDAQRQNLLRIVRPLDHPGASRNAARMALDLMMARD
jgi:lipid-A-disaccharide synthase